MGIEQITDWEERIAGYTDKQKAYYHKMLPLWDELKALSIDSNGWSTQVDDKRAGIRIESKRSELRNLLTMRATGSIDYPPIDVWRCLNYMPTRQEWDVNAEDVHFMGKVGANAYTIYNLSKKIFFVAGREFLLDFFTNQEADGTIFIVISTNRELYDLVPERKGIVRAESPVGGWILTPDAQNPNKTHCKLMIEINFGGNIPDLAVKTAFRDQGYQIDKLRKTLPKFKERFPE